MALTSCCCLFAFVGVGAREGGQKETGEHGALFDARSGKIKRGNVRPFM